MIDEPIENHCFPVDTTVKYMCDILHHDCLSYSHKCSECDIYKFHKDCERRMKNEQLSGKDTCLSGNAER
jgi:hypothetical protein